MSARHGRGCDPQARHADDTDANLPVSTLIRIWALDRMHADVQGAGGTVADRLKRLEREVFKHSA